jgi:transcriptional regulator with XRE-family HTH domain
VVYLRRLRYWRERRALTQEQLAELAGLTQQTIWNLENDKVQPRTPTIRKLADALGVKPASLMGPPERWARIGVLRAYVKRGELPAFKGARHVNVLPADLGVVRGIDWQHPPAELESAELHSLHQRMLDMLGDASLSADAVFERTCSVDAPLRARR